MDASGGVLPERQEEAFAVEELFPCENTEGCGGGDDDGNLEWLSIFVEDCLSCTSSYSSQILPPPPPTTITTTTTTTHQPPIIPRISKRRRTTTTTYPPETYHLMNFPEPSNPTLLPQSHWLAESELVFPKKEEEEEETIELPDEKPKRKKKKNKRGKKKVMKGLPLKVDSEEVRRCAHCLSHRTPQWRTGPLGPKTLCNACGVRFKKGRLLPEYRPANSPTFMSCKHSNSHKKVMEMRMGVLSSMPN
ncbi:GATA transcription factor 4 [Acorus gramineus]|uniref:GATA transcription factor 4 n=1 Tax=Acorus gramineus TaxID=55184 RepID=A0AAV9B421_ACOGR|nr:GATA transcription factor 4 [Acorus gramineus]